MKKIGCFVIFLLFAVIAYLTNPTEDQHIEKAYQILREQGVKNFGINSDYLAIGEGLVGKDNMNEFMSKFIKRKNYYLFSLTEVDINGIEQIVGIGLFGKVWDISPAIDFVSKGIDAASEE